MLAPAHLSRVRPSRPRLIRLLSVGRWVAFPLGAGVAMFVLPLLPLKIAGLVVLGLLSAAMEGWMRALQRQHIREAPLPAFLARQLREQFPQLTAGDADLVLRGLRQFFLAHLRSGRQFVAMPSVVVDAAWHAFILHTQAYERWCRVAFGGLMHHTPAEALGRNPRRNDGLRRTWYWACREESIDPRAPSRLPLLFALDRKLAIPGGFSYVPDCRDIDRQSGSGTHCGTSFGESGGGSGDADGFGGSESTGDGGSDGGGDGGGGD